MTGVVVCVLALVSCLTGFVAVSALELERLGALADAQNWNQRGEEVLAEVKSAWCCIDAETLRPARINEEMREFFFPKPE